MNWLDALSESKAVSRPVPSGNGPRLPEGQGRGEGRAGDDFNESADWADILKPLGAVLHHEASGGERFWTRPGKDRRNGYSATTGYADDADRLKVFTSSWPPFTDGEVYAKFGAYALLNHGGDYKAAARALAEQGYGEPADQPDAKTADSGYEVPHHADLADAAGPAAAEAPENREVPWPDDPAPADGGGSVTGQEMPRPAEGTQSPGAIAIQELRQVQDEVQGQAEQFLTASVIVGAAVRQRAGEADLIALKREAKALRLMSFGEFDQVVREARSQGGDGDDDGAGSRGPSQATRLVTLATRMYDFGVTRNGDPFAVPRQGGNVARMLRGGRPPLRPELASAMYAAEGTAPNGSAMTDAMAVLEGQAQQADPVELALRTARDANGLLLDLGDVTGRAVMVTPDGWEITDRSPVLFRRTAATLALPQPVGGGDLDDTLFGILNISKENRPLMKAVLVHYLWPDIGHVIARLTGRDGTAKTWATRILRSLIDPSAAPTRAVPRDETDWIIAVNAALIAAIDNVSAIPDWLSDAMCRASTGEGLMRRKLYSDQDVSILSARRIVILNGIDATIRRADFARRIADFELEQIKKIKSDSEVGDEWQKVHPYALGALLDLTVQTLKRLPGTVLAGPEESLTMGDFVRIAKAVGEPGLKLYISRLGTAAADVVESDPFARSLIKFVGGRPQGKWFGLAGELVAAIPGPDPLPKGWPRDPTRFGVWVKRMGRVLETTAGIRITKEDRTAEGQPYTLERVPSADPAMGVGNPATSATQLQGDASASADARKPDVAGEQAQLHSYSDRDQRGCSSVADVAEIPALQDRAGKDIRAEATWLARRDPDAPNPRPCCRHPACWDALAGECLAGRGLCLICGGALDPKLAAGGDTTHANCAEDPAA